MKYTPIIVSILLCILSNFSIGQCSINFTTTNYNNYNVSCFGNCDGKIWVNPTGNAPFTYSWSTGQTWQNIDTLCSGTYTLTLTDNSGCTITETITLNEPSELVSSLIVSTPISSLGACDGGLTASAIGGVPNYTLQWYDCANDLTGFTWDFTNNMCAGEWGAIFVDMNGCIDTTCIMLEFDTCAYVSQNYSLGGLDCAWGVYQSNFPIDSYQWVNCDDLYSPFAGDTNEFYQSIYDGNVAVIIEMQGCIDTSFCYDICSWGIEEISITQKELVKIIDITGRETNDKPFTLLVYIYNDGTTEKVYRIE